MTQHSQEDFGLDVKGEFLLQLFYKGTKTFLKPKFFSINSQN